MAITIDNLFASGFSGKVGGNMVFRRRKSGKIVIARAPKKSKIAPSEKQRAMRGRFATATKYARLVRDNPSLYAQYAAAVEGDQTPSNLAIRDSYTPPQVVSINVSGYLGEEGDMIGLRAIDDFKVDRVRISIFTAAGDLLEEGEAVQAGDTNDWIYTATVANKQPKGCSVKAVATDLPGNEGVRELQIG